MIRYVFQCSKSFTFHFKPPGSLFKKTGLSVIPTRQLFESQSRVILGLERLMLEASGFDFRNRHPQPFLIKLAKFYNYSKASPMVKTAYAISLDLYRTFAPLKQQTATLAFACLELAGRLRQEEDRAIWQGRDYSSWQVERGMVMGMSCLTLSSFSRSALSSLQPKSQLTDKSDPQKHYSISSNSTHTTGIKQPSGRTFRSTHFSRHESSLIRSARRNNFRDSPPGWMKRTWDSRIQVIPSAPDQERAPIRGLMDPLAMANIQEAVDPAKTSAREMPLGLVRTVAVTTIQPEPKSAREARKVPSDSS